MRFSALLRLYLPGVQDLVAALLIGSAAIAATPALASDGVLNGALGNVDGLDVHASVRLRYEALDNQFRPGLDRKDDIVVLRTLVQAQYDAGALRFAAELEDSRAYDTDAGGAVSTTEVDTLELLQGYVGLDLGGNDKPAVAIDVGRFTMDIGARRLVARNGFRNTINGFTGVRATVAGPRGSRLLLFYTMPQVRFPADKASILHNEHEWNRESSDLVFWGGSLDLPGDRKLGLLSTSFFALKERDRADLATRDRHLYTADLRLVRKPKPGTVDWDAEAAFQFGSISAGTAALAPRLPVAAWFVHAGVGYQWDHPWKPRLSIVYDLGTGDDSKTHYTRFDTLFGARRLEFGPTSIYGLLGRGNISSPGALFEAAPGKRLSVAGGIRAAWLVSAVDSFASTGVRDATGRSGRFAGEQVEGRVRYSLVPGMLQAEAGGAVFFSDRFLDSAPNANGYGNPIYGYAQLELTL